MSIKFLSLSIHLKGAFITFRCYNVQIKVVIYILNSYVFLEEILSFKMISQQLISVSITFWCGQTEAKTAF